MLTDIIDPNYTHELKTHKDKAKLPELRRFMKTHCRVSTYMFVIRRCEQEGCFVCGHGRTPRCGGLFDDISMHDPPLPSMKANRTSYASFDTLKGQPSDETELPSMDIRKHDRNGIAERKAADKATKAQLGSKIFVQENAAHYFRCSSCMAARLIYSTKPKATIQSQMGQLVRYVASVDYLCGDDLFADGSPAGASLQGTFAVRQHLQSGRIDGVSRAYCNMPTQHAYFTRASFPVTCAWCDENAQGELLMESDHDASELAGKRCDPICKHCKLVRTMALPLWGAKANGTGGRTIGRSGNGASSTKASNDDASGVSSSSTPAAVKETRANARTSTSAPRTRGLVTGGCSASGKSGIESLFARETPCVSYLQTMALWSSEHNSACEECNLGGNLILCSYCNLAWHRACLEKPGLLLPETKSLLEDDDAHWPCSQCVSEAKRRQTAKAAFKVGGCANTNARAMKKKHNPKRDGITDTCKTCTMPVSSKICYSCRKRICTICDTWNRNIKRSKDLERHKCRSKCQLDDSDERADSDDDA